MNSAQAMDLCPITERQRRPAYKGAWKNEVSCRRYPQGRIQKRGKRNPVWESEWWEDDIKEDDSMAGRWQTAVLGLVSEATRSKETSRDPFAVPAESCCCDERVDFTDDDAVRFRAELAGWK